MLISQEVQSQSSRPHGSGSGSLAELRRQLAAPSDLSDGNRQRLLELVRRLARVRSLGDEYGRVELSEHSQEAMKSACPAALA